MTRIDHPLLRLIADPGTAASGVLTATRGKLRRLFCFEDGAIIFAASNVIEEQYDAELVRSGLLPAAALQSAREQAKSKQQKLGAYLLSQGRPDSESLVGAMERHVTALLRSSLEWVDGAYSMAPGTPNLAGEVTVRLPASGLVFELVTEHPAEPGAVLPAIGPPGVLLESGDGSRIDTRDPLRRHLLDPSSGPRSVEQIVEHSPAPEARTVRGVLALTLLGALRQTGATEDGKGEAFGVTREECAARLGQSDDATHYEILGLNSDAKEGDVRDAYYYLARRYHPDRFRSGTLTDYHQGMEKFFSGVTEAYNTLIDSELREAYDEELEKTVGRKQPDAQQDRKSLARQNFARAKILIDKRRLQDSVRFLENAIELDETEPAYYLELGRVLTLNPRQRHDAERALRKTLELNPTLVPALVALGELYIKMNRGSDAADAFHEALRWEPGNLEATAGLARVGQPAGGSSRGGLFGS